MKQQVDFIRRAKEVHGNLYEYSLVEYKNRKTKVKIIDTEYGVFEQRPDSHLNGRHGHPKRISKSISENNKHSHDSFVKSLKLYIIKLTNNDTAESFFKIGKTFQKIQNRVRGFAPYKSELIGIRVFQDSYECSRHEVKMLQANKTKKYTPQINFKGCYECFSEIIVWET